VYASAALECTAVCVALHSRARQQGFIPFDS